MKRKREIVAEIKVKPFILALSPFFKIFVLLLLKKGEKLRIVCN